MFFRASPAAVRRREAQNNSWLLRAISASNRQIPIASLFGRDFLRGSPGRPTPTLLRLRLLFFAMLGLSTLAPAAKLPVPGVTGTDNRTINNSRSYPWSAIGRLNITTGGFCTATVIGPRRLLTAAHCLWNKRTARWLPPCALHFLAGYRRGEYEVHALASGFTVSPSYEIGKKNPANDWAVVTLDRDVSPKTGVIDLARSDSGALKQLVQAGYSRDHRHVLTVDRNCAQTGVSRGGEVMLHDCDATFGDSGSPLLIRQEKGYRLVGIHVAITGRGNSTRGIAVSSQAFRDWVAKHPVTAPLGGVKACMAPAPPSTRPHRDWFSNLLPGIDLS